MTMILAKPRLLAALLLTATAAVAQPVRHALALFPAEEAPHASGKTITVRVGPATRDVLQVTPVTFLSRAGVNRGEGSKSMCGVVIAVPGRQPQGVITVGTGVTEATPSCDAVLAVGAVPGARNGPVRRLGVIHAVSSRNAADGRAAVVLHRNGAGNWSVDEGATARADTITHFTIAALRRRLR